MDENAIVALIFSRLDHCDGTVACDELGSYRYTGRAFREDDKNAPDGSWGVYDRKFSRYVHPVDLQKIDPNERMVS